MPQAKPAAKSPGSSVYDTREQRLAAFRELAEAIQQRLGGTRKDAVAHIAMRFNKSVQTINAWLSNNERGLGISAEALDLLRIEELLLADPKARDGIFAEQLRAHDPKWHARRKAQPVKVSFAA